MYGQVQKAGFTNKSVLQYGIPIPFQTLRNKKQLKLYRSYFVYNQDMPGAMENVHPNKFIANLRPVQEFRHTPIVPISQKQITNYEKTVEERNRKGYYVEIKKDTIYYWGIVTMILFIIVYIFLFVNEKQMKIKYQIQKSRYQKHGAMNQLYKQRFGTSGVTH